MLNTLTGAHNEVLGIIEDGLFLEEYKWEKSGCGGDTLRLKYYRWLELDSGLC